MKIAVIGTGYVGLVTGTGLAEIGHNVICVDKDMHRVENLNQNIMPIFEPGLEELVIRNVEEERLSFTTDLKDAVEKSLVIFLCVGTPSAADGSADLSAVFDVAEIIATVMPGYRIIVNKSTCPVGTTDQIYQIVSRTTSHPFDVVSNPEFLREGSAVDDFMRPDRVVVGCDDIRVQEIMRELYSPVLRTGNPFLVMSRHSAELAKYACNTMLAARISMMNELACICESSDADITDVREAVATDSRIGSKYLYASLGYGGSCLPKDVAACARMASDAGLGEGIISAIMAVNKRQIARFTTRILEYYGDDISNKILALWGVAFKARTDDLREAPSLYIIDALLEAGATLRAYDPEAANNLKSMYGNRVEIVKPNYKALEQADGLIIPTEWREFQSPDYDRMFELMREHVIFDGRNLFNPQTVAQHGFKYFSIGRPDCLPDQVTP